jgi:hypothetical protein
VRPGRHELILNAMAGGTGFAGSAAWAGVGPAEQN